MISIDISKLKKLRAETGFSFSLCKKALEEASGDLKNAKKIIQSYGKKIQEKVSEHSSSEGAIFCYVHHNAKIGVLVEIRCETDFVAQNSDFKRLGQEIAMQICFSNPKDVNELLKSPYIRDSAKVIQQMVNENIAKIGEKITISNFVRFEIN